MIYLDYSANTPVDPEVLDVYTKTALHFPGNPNSAHAAGREAAEEMERVTERIASELTSANEGSAQVLPEELIYTSGSSESNNLAVKGLAHAQRHKGRHIISTALEHSSLSGALTALKDQGWEIDLISVGRDGKIDLEELRSLLRKDTVLVAVSAVDSELGTKQPIREIAEILKDFPGTRLHVDATQAVGKTPLLFDGVDTLCFTPHKFYGLLGCGILYKRKGVILEPQINGGVSTTMYRSGTPDLAGAAALEKALAKAVSDYEERAGRVRELNARLRRALSAYPSVSINSPDDAVPHILNISVKGIKGDLFQQALDKKGVCISVKSACSVKGTPSKAVYAVCHDRRRAMESWRISLSHLTTDEEIDGFLQAFDSCLKDETLTQRK